MVAPAPFEIATRLAWSQPENPMCYAQSLCQQQIVPGGAEYGECNICACANERCDCGFCGVNIRSDGRGDADLAFSGLGPGGSNATDTGASNLGCGASPGSGVDGAEVCKMSDVLEGVRERPTRGLGRIGGRSCGSESNSTGVSGVLGDARGNAESDCL